MTGNEYPDAELRKRILLPVIDASDDDGDPGWAPDHHFEPAGHGTSRWLSRPGTWHDLRDDITASWVQACLRYEADPANFESSYNYLDGHPAYWEFIKPATPPRRRWRRRRTGQRPKPRNHVSRLMYEDGIRRCVFSSLTHVNPETGRWADELVTNLNTELRIAFETGPSHLWAGPERAVSTHDYQLDCLSRTYELGIIRMALNVWTHYGNDRVICDTPAGVTSGEE